MTASIRTLNILAASVWYVGGIVLLIKGSSLLVEAYSLKPEQYWPWLAIVVGPVIGSIKGKFIFRKSCLKNLARIDALNQPKIWHFFQTVVLCRISHNDNVWCNYGEAGAYAT